MVPGTGYWVLINFATGSITRLDAFQKELFEIAPELPEELPVIAGWKKGGFLTDITDEAAWMHDQIEESFRALEQGKQVRPLTLRLYTTYACNFRCSYCFQDGRGGPMSRDVQDAVAAFAEESFRTWKHDALKVEWYGGEPLLEPGIIEDLSRRFMDIADSHGAAYSANITTNGWFLDQRMTDMLERVKVKTAYITLDGIGDLHDQCRHLANGGPTSQRIIHNLRSIRTSVFISLRCNLHKGNLSGFGELCDLVEDLSAQSGNTIRLIPAKVEITPRVEKRDHHVIPVSSEELEWAYKRSGYTAKKDPFQPKFMLCRGTDPFGFIIDEKGLIFPNCNNHAEEKNNAFGSLTDGSSMKDIYQKSFEHARSWSFPADSADCKSCRMLICCNGGCPSHAFERGRHFCLERVSDPESYAIMRYHKAFDEHETRIYNNFEDMEEKHGSEIIDNIEETPKRALS